MNRLTICCVLAATVVVAGCEGSGQEEVQAWMNEERARTKPKVDPIPEPKKFSPQAYGAEAAVEPFSNRKLMMAFEKERASGTSQSAALVAPELNRRKEPLEAYPLDAIAMVGSLVKQGKPIALVRVDNLLYQVKLGDYLGQNYGRITKVGETEVVLRELVQDATGEWIERNSTLQLQERSR